MIYLDYTAATPVNKEVIDTFCSSLKYYANPNSNHKLGMEANYVIEQTTRHIAKLLEVKPSEIIYTSGATESNNLAIKGICERYKAFGKHILISPLEHNSLLSSCTKIAQQGFEVEVLPLDKNGQVDINKFKKLIREDTILVSVTSLDSELGLVQPIDEIGKILKDYPNTCFHTDATQAIGKIEINLRNVDLVTFAPHKFYGLNGIGVLIKKDNVELLPLIDGGKSTTVYRSGSPDLPNIVALDKALDITLSNLKERYDYVEILYEKLINRLKKYDRLVINNTLKSIPYTINFSIRNTKANDLVELLDKKGIIVSAKTSCCPKVSPSKLVYALTRDKQLAISSIRISLSHLTTEAEIDEFINIFDTIYKEYVDGKI